MNTVKVMIVDDHPVVREGLRALLAKTDVARVVAEAGDGREAIDKLRAVDVELVLMDWQLPTMDGLATTTELKKSWPHVKVLMLTNRLDAESVKQAIKAGASGYLLKDVSKDDLERAIQETMDGKTVLHEEAQFQLAAALTATDPIENLTQRERDVFVLLGRGRSNKEIGRELGLTEGTVKGYVSAVLLKTGTADRTQAALLATKLGLV
ncbi:MAG: response regulator transcription factor [Armatimonadetes bacterium]|nr:response regulator transcription factor [Armatimonadota bacterium]